VGEDTRGAAALFDGADPTQAVLRATDWPATPLGPVDGWPAELRAAVRTVLPSRVPMLLLWGKELRQIYNDAFTPLIGEKHPRAIGQDAADCCPGSWGELGPLAESVLAGGAPTNSRDICLPCARHGYVEETFWTFSCSPVCAGDAVAGVFIAAFDTTSRVLAERRLRVLYELGGRLTAEACSAAEVCRTAIAVLAEDRRDVPFALAYGRDEEGSQVRVAATFGVAADAVERFRVAGPGTVRWQLVASGQAVEVAGIRARFGSIIEPVAPGRTPADSAMLLPLTDWTSGRVVGAIALGMSPYRAFDEEYRHFFELVAHQMSTAMTDALAYQAERTRAEALEALDRVKTRFLQNVSRQFRTPLTLVLGALAELAKADAPELPPSQRVVLNAARRATHRLERLVESLPRFTRADGEPHVGREPTDVAALTAECADVFRPTIERAGLSLVVDVSSALGLVELDQEMWVRILSNLLSNAVRFTAAGTITVRLRHNGRLLVLDVADTGAGIPADEIPLIFDRFHQVPGVAACTREGAGPGLSLVADLVAALGGDIGVALGTGSTFTVTIPVRPTSEHGRVRTAAMVHARVAAAEADSWLDLGPDPELHAAEQAPGPGTVVLVEDDVDMRAYLTRLLRGDGWGVDAVADAAGALRAVEARCDLVLSDVMLPGTDGIELVRTLRADPATARLPIILLTARAGPESAAQGLGAGADDYVVTPFDPVELLARVRVHFELTRLREHAVDQAERRVANLRAALASNRQIGAAIGILMQQHKVTENDGFELLRRASQTTNRKLRDIADEVVLTGVLPSNPGGSGS
jgi:signal transduction histidine kinase/DNA-binding response OmpR family regulator